MFSSQNLTHTGIKAHVRRMDNDSPLIRSDTLNSQEAMSPDVSEMPANAPLLLNDQPSHKPFNIGDHGVKFTSEMARAAAQRRWDASRATHTASLNKSVPKAKDEALAAVSDKYLKARLRRVRELLDIADVKANELLQAKPIDWQAVERASRAISSLSSLEQQLDGRPSAGSFKPTTAKPRDRRMENIGPVG